MTAYQEESEEDRFSQKNATSWYTTFSILAAGLLLMVFVSLRGRTSETAGPTQVITPRSMAEYRSLTDGKEAKPALLKFYANWCGPCRTFGPIFDRASETKSLDVNYLAINVDNLGEVGQKYGVRSIPCVVAIDARGREKGRKVGVLRPDEIREMEETVTRQ